jgi:integrase/recombinase XerD
MPAWPPCMPSPATRRSNARPRSDKCNKHWQFLTSASRNPCWGFCHARPCRLAAPDPSTWVGRRDRLLLALPYNTGARVSELVAVRAGDVVLAATSTVRMHGKGRKQRTVPLWKETADLARQWIRNEALRPDEPLLPNRNRRAMSRGNAAERVALAARAAQPNCPALAGQVVTPHTIRHSTAMHLLQSGVDLTVIALWLGHESPVTTHGYVEADLAMKERALAALDPPGIKAGRYRAKDGLLAFLESL